MRMLEISNLQFFYFINTISFAFLTFFFLFIIINNKLNIKFKNGYYKKAGEN